MPGAWPRVVSGDLDVLILGQITVDDTVPAIPGPWSRHLGGNALYAAAGARLWCQPERIGVVARVSSQLPFDSSQILKSAKRAARTAKPIRNLSTPHSVLRVLLKSAGLSADGLVPVETEPLIEWIVYEADGNRQSLPRNPSLRDPAADGPELFRRYVQHLEGLSAPAADIPTKWLPAKAIHLAPQVLQRHASSCRALMDKTKFLSVDPSPHYSRSRGAAELVELLAGVTAFLPSQAEVQHLRDVYHDWPSVALALRHAGFAEVLLKLGSAGALLSVADSDPVVTLPAAPASPVDLTGAGDAFSGAYAASRALGHSPREAGARAAVAAAMIVECSGALEALSLRPQLAAVRLKQYLDIVR